MCVRYGVGDRRPESNSWIVDGHRRTILVKRMCDAVGLGRAFASRVVAGLRCGDLQRGKWRHLNREELRKLKAKARTAKNKRDKSRQEPK